MKVPLVVARLTDAYDMLTNEIGATATKSHPPQWVEYRDGLYESRRKLLEVLGEIQSNKRPER